MENKLASDDSKKKNFGIESSVFDVMLNQLRKGDERLFEKIFLAHVEDCIAFVIRKYQVSQEIAYDATLETLLDFRKRLLDGKVKYGNMRYLFTKMAGQKVLKAIKKWSPEELEQAAEPTEEVSFDDGILDILDKSWSVLGENCSRLLKSFYYYNQQLKSIAEEVGKSEAALRKQKQRCLQQLRSLFLERYEA